MCLGQASAQTPTEGGKPSSIGIALEGGGALGLAHIGVLKWMEEHRIPIDFVAGTSMGGLVGGMYATGMTPAELEKVVLGIDWEAALGEQIAYRDLIFRRKQDRREFQNSLQFGLKNGFTAPGGLNSGQAITFLFDRHALAYSDLKSFDELPIPFRCVAADLKTGKAHVFEHGPLGFALRATMSLPAVFTPVPSDETLYVDGGLLNNLPVDVVKQMGAGMAIAVYLNTPASEKSASVSMFSVMGRSIGLMIAANELRNMEMADLVLSVDLKGFTASDYSRGPQIIQRGYEAAVRKSAVLSRFALSEDVWHTYLERRYARKIKPALDPTALQITGVKGALKTDLEEVFSKHIGKQLNTEALERDIQLVAGVGRFSRFSYRVVDVDNKSTLVVNAEEHGYAPPFLNLGVSIDGTDYQNVRFSLNGRLTALDLGGFRSELRTDFSIGSTWAIGTEYYRPFTARSRWFYAPHVSAADNPFDLYNRSDRLATYRIVRYVAGLDAGYAINRFSELRAGYELGHFGSNVEIGQAILPTPSGRMGSTSIRYELDMLDKPVVPRRGQSVRAQTRWFDAMPGARKGFPLSEVYFATFKPVSKPASVYMQTYGGTTFGHADTGLPQFLLGGPGRLSSYGLNEIRGNQYFLGRLGYLRELFQLPPLIGTKVYLNGVYEVGKMWGPLVASRLPMDGAVGIVMETILGPLAVGGSIGDRGHQKWYFQVGRIF
jgi:NTE family protein